MPLVREDDLIASVADALQYISYYHTPDFIAAMGRAYELEQSAPARDAIAQILTNSRLCAEGHRPICQDTGIVVVFVKVGMGVRWDSSRDLETMINEGVRRAYLDPDNKLRASIVADPAGKRTGTRDNTPAVIHTELVPGDRIEITVAAKGGGSENKSMFAMLNPSDSVADWVVEMVPEMGAGWCPPGMLGVGIGGSAEKAMLLAKKSLMEPIDMPELLARGPSTRLEELRIEIYRRVNDLGIGAQGLGGLTTVLDVKVLDYPTHAASLPVAVIPNCAATRHAHFTLDGTGPAVLVPPDLSQWPKVTWRPDAQARRVSLDGLTREEIATWKAGERLLLSGKLLTGRDAAHKRICALLEAGKPLPDGLDFRNRLIYYVGPVDPVGAEVVGRPARPPPIAWIALPIPCSARRVCSPWWARPSAALKPLPPFAAHRSAYLIAVGGAAFLVSQAIRASRVVGFPELGMEAVYEFDVRDMPVTVAVSSEGESVHDSGPPAYRGKFAGIPVTVASAQAPYLTLQP